MVIFFPAFTHCPLQFHKRLNIGFYSDMTVIYNNNNNNNWFLQPKGIEPTQIPVTSWRAGSTLTVDSP